MQLFQCLILFSAPDKIYQEQKDTATRAIKSSISIKRLFLPYTLTQVNSASQDVEKWREKSSL